MITVKKIYEHKELSKHPLYATWANIKQRCLNKNFRDYHCYGGRGIKVCPEWMNSFHTFLNDVGERPPGTQLDRIDNNGDYKPGNVRWVTHAENQKNRRGAIKKNEIERLYPGLLSETQLNSLENSKTARLGIEIKPVLHQDIKIRAAFRNITIRKWVLIAILEQIKQEKKTE